MSTMTFFFVLVCIIVGIFLVMNQFIAKQNPDQYKDGPFECGFSSWIQSWLGVFNVSFYGFSFTYLVFDTELILLTPYTLTAGIIDVYGLTIMLFFSVLITIGFFFELGKGALNIFNKQQDNLSFNKNLMDNPLSDLAYLTLNRLT